MRATPRNDDAAVCDFPHFIGSGDHRGIMGNHQDGSRIFPHEPDEERARRRVQTRLSFIEQQESRLAEQRARQ